MPIVVTRSPALPPAEQQAFPALTPVQQQALDILGAPGPERPHFDPALGKALRAELEDRLAPLVAGPPDGEALFVRKHDLAAVHGCEGAWLAQRAEPFTWSAATARGTVAHKAIELSVHWHGDPTPVELVEAALCSLRAGGGDSLSAWLAELSEGQSAELRGEAAARVAKFLECFPPLRPSWRPVPESRLRAELCERRVVLVGKVDLTLGAASGTVAGKVLVDMKTGGFAPSHREDLRFYALIETLRIGVPPRLLASCYLDSGELHPEPVTEALLWAAVERTVAGVNAIVSLVDSQRDPVLRPGAGCGWCPIRGDCEIGSEWLRNRAESDGW